MSNEYITRIKQLIIRSLDDIEFYGNRHVTVCLSDHGEQIKIEYKDYNYNEEEDREEEDTD